MNVLILGGYGFFGSRLTRLLSSQSGLRIFIAGRNIAGASRLAEELRGSVSCCFPVAVDSNREADLKAMLVRENINILINASGPFQIQDYSLAMLCIKLHCHYIDLADARNYVVGMQVLHEAALASGVTVCAGSSSVPGLSSIVIADVSQYFSSMTEIHIGISPGNKTDRGLATIRSILSYCGEYIPLRKNGLNSSVRAWTRSIRHTYPDPVGARWITDCDVPDIELLARRYPTLKTVRFRAGLELSVLHLGLMFLSWMRALRLIGPLDKYASIIKWLSERFMHFGSDAGAMHISVIGLVKNGCKEKREWTLVAKAGDGPYVPTLCAAAITMKLKNVGQLKSGVCSAHELIEMRDINVFAQKLSILMAIEVC